MPITDISNNQLTTLPLTLTESTTSQVIVVRVTALTGQYLATTADSRARVLARRSGSGDAFVDIATSPILLTPYADTPTDFDMKVTASEISGLERLALPVRVTFRP